MDATPIKEALWNAQLSSVESICEMCDRFFGYETKDEMNYCACPKTQEKIKPEGWEFIGFTRLNHFVSAKYGKIENVIKGKAVYSKKIATPYLANEYLAKLYGIIRCMEEDTSDT